MYRAADLFDLSQTEHALLFDGCEYAWEALKKIKSYLAISVRPALHHKREGESFIHESIIGSTFTGTVESVTKVGDYPAIVPGIEGWAKIYGYNTISIDEEDDPYAYGFQVL